MGCTEKLLPDHDQRASGDEQYADRLDHSAKPNSFQEPSFLNFTVLEGMLLVK